MPGQNSLDFVGYTTGKPPVNAGFRGLMDFVGYPIGRGETIIPPQPVPMQRIARGGAKKTKRRTQDDELLLLI